MTATGKPSPGRPLPRRRERRVFPWVFAVLQVLLALFTFGSATSDYSHQQRECGAESGIVAQACISGWETTTGRDLLTGIGLWAAVDVITGAGYGVYRLSRRD